LGVPTKVAEELGEEGYSSWKPEDKKGLLERGSAGLRVEKDSERIDRRYKL